MSDWLGWSRAPVLPALPGLRIATSRLRLAAADWAAAERGRFALFLPLCMAAGAALYLTLTAEPAWWVGR